MVPEAPDFILAYDASCGPCSGFRAIVDFLDARRRIGFVPLDVADGSGLLSGIAPASRYTSFHLIGSASGAAGEDVVWSGSEALMPLIRLLFPGGLAASRIIEGIPGGLTAISFAYTTLSRLHRACSVGPASELPAEGSARHFGSYDNVQRRAQAW